MNSARYNTGSPRRSRASGPAAWRVLDLAARRRGVLLLRELLDQPDVGANLLEHPVLECSPSRHRLGLVESELGLLGFPGGQVRHAQVVEGRRLGGALARAAKAIDRAVELAAL